MPIADSLISSNDDKRLYFNTISDLAYIDNGHGNSLTDYPNQFFMVFDFTSTQQASNDFIHSELTNCSISIELKFSASLPNNIEIFIICKKSLHRLCGFCTPGFKKSHFKQLIDEDGINDLIQKCRKLKYKFRGVFAANDFPQKGRKIGFLIVNASPTNSPRTHWLLLCNRNYKIISADPLEQSIIAYRNLYHRLFDTNAQICQFFEHIPIQSQNSELCGVFVFILRMLYLVKEKL